MKKLKLIVYCCYMEPHPYCLLLHHFWSCPPSCCTNPSPRVSECKYVCGICAGKISQFLLHDYMYLLQYWQTAKVYGVQLTLFGSGRYQSINNLAFNISFNLYFYDEYSRKVGKWLNIVITMLDVNRSHLAY